MLMANSNGFWLRYSSDLFHKLIRNQHLNGVHVTEAEHPQFFASLKNLAARSGLTKVPDMAVVDGLLLGGTPAWAKKAPNAAGAPGYHFVLVNKPMLELTGASLDHAITPQLEPTLAHEFQHLKESPLHVGMLRTAHITLPLIAMAGLYLYDRAKAKTTVSYEENQKLHCRQLLDSIHQTADQENADCRAAEKPGKWGMDSSWQKSIMEQARYWMVAAVGMAAGLAVARYGLRRLEFRADKLAVEVTGNPALCKDVLARMEKLSEEARASMPAADTFGKKVTRWFQDFLSSTLDAHPTLAERHSYMDHVGQQLARSASHTIPGWTPL